MPLILSSNTIRDEILALYVSPRSSGDRARPSGGRCTGSNPVEGALNKVEHPHYWGFSHFTDVRHAVNHPTYFQYTLVTNR